MRLKKVLGSILSLGMLLSPLTVYAEESEDVVAYTQDNRTFTSMEDAWNMARGGTLVYLNKDWDMSSRLILQSGENVTLDLNGHSITRQLSKCESDGEVIYMNENSNLTLQGSTDRTFTVKDWKGYYTDKSDTVDVTTGGVITGGMSNNGGGGIKMSADSILNLDNVGVVGNETYGTFSPNGGGIKIVGDACTINMTNGSIVSYNKASYGGGLYVNGQEAHINVSASEISNNYASGEGGGICSSEDATYIELNENAAVKENYSYYDGGGISFRNSYNHINSKDGTGKISSNYAEGDADSEKAFGGGIYYALVIGKTNTATITNITLEDNTANQSLTKSYGGAIFCDLGNVEITNCTIKNNYSVYGGGIYVNDSGTIIKDCTITNNEGYSNGGGIFVDSRYDVKLSGKCIIKQNHGHYDNQNNIYLQNGSFTRAYVSGTPSAESEVGLSGYGDCKVGINQSENNGTFFVDYPKGYHLEYDDGKLYQKNGTTGSIFGSGNIVVASVFLVCIVGVGFVVYKKKKKMI